MVIRCCRFDILGIQGSPAQWNQFRLGKVRHFPCFAPTAIPNDVGITQRDQAQCQIAAIEPLGVPADRDDRPGEIAPRQPRHGAAQTVLGLVGEGAADASMAQADGARERAAPEIEERIDDERLPTRQKGAATRRWRACLISASCLLSRHNI